MNKQEEEIKQLEKINAKLILQINNIRHDMTTYLEELDIDISSFNIVNNLITVTGTGLFVKNGNFISPHSALVHMEEIRKLLNRLNARLHKLTFVELKIHN